MEIEHTFSSTNTFKKYIQSLVPALTHIHVAERLSDYWWKVFPVLNI